MTMKSAIQRHLYLLLAIVVFLAPTNLFLNLTEQYAFVTGLRVDYLIPKLYILDIAMLAVIGLYLLSIRPAASIRTVTQHKWKLMLFVFIFIQQLVSPLPVIGLWTLFQWLLILGCFYIAYKTKFFNTLYFYASIVVTILFQSSIGIGQFLLQHSIGSYYFLGETDLSSFAGVAKTSLFGIEKVLAYGTTAHPNVLGGYLAIYMLMALVSVFASVSESAHKTVKTFVLTLGTICLLLTGSLSALSTFIIGLVYFFMYPGLKKKSKLTQTLILILILIPLTISLTSGLTDNSSLQRRAVLNQAATELILDKPFGVGLSQFVTGVEQFTQTNEVVRFLQPVHHVPLLILTEIGLIPVIILLYLIYHQTLKQKQSPIPNLTPIFILTPILTLDHYLWSIEPGRVLLVLALCFSYTHFLRH